MTCSTESKKTVHVFRSSSAVISRNYFKEAHDGISPGSLRVPEDGPLPSVALWEGLFLRITEVSWWPIEAMPLFGVWYVHLSKLLGNSEGQGANSEVPVHCLLEGPRGTEPQLPTEVTCSLTDPFLPRFPAEDALHLPVSSCQGIALIHSPHNYFLKWGIRDLYL